MVFIVKDKLESIGADENVFPLSENHVCGEKLFAWCLERYANKDGGRTHLSGQRLLSTRTVRCLTDVEAFALRVADLEEDTVICARFLRNPRVQRTIRSLEKQLRCRDVEKWMSHRRLPDELKRKVRQAERLNWSAAQGVNEEKLLEILPEDLQRDIQRHFFYFLKKVQLFSLIDEPVLDAIFAKLRQTLYIRGSDILHQGSPIDKMIFIVKGKLESIGADGNMFPLSENHVCGEELFAWCLERSANKNGGRTHLSGQRLLSTQTVRFLTDVEAFALRVADLEDDTVICARFLRNPRVQRTIRYESQYLRHIAAMKILMSWRKRQRRLRRASAASASNKQGLFF